MVLLPFAKSARDGLFDLSVEALRNLLVERCVSLGPQPDLALAGLSLGQSIADP
jgi:hypothetical protein